MDEKYDLMTNERHLLFVMDFYDTHVSYNTPNELCEDIISVICMRSHTSHIIQQLDLSLLSTFKCAVSREFEKLTRKKNIVDAFDATNVFITSYRSHHIR